MKDNKTFLHKIEQFKPKIPVDLETEKQLLPRLKFMGILLLTFAAGSFGYASFESKEMLGQDGYDTPLEMQSTSGLNFSDFDPELPESFSAYVAGVSFALVGLSCLFYYRTKKRKLL